MEFKHGLSLSLWSVMVMAMMAAAFVAALPTPPKTADVKFGRNYAVRWAPENSKQLRSGSEIQLMLTNHSGSGFGSKNKYLFGYVGMRIKLVANESAGTVATFYMSSETPTNHDEIDFEFLGNTSGQPYTVHTNVFANGIGQREQRISLWFDPTLDFHTYSFLWNRQIIIFYIDDVPIRTFKNNSALGVPFPFDQPMGVYASLWNGDDWATRGGLEKIKWKAAPFVASFQGFGIDACNAGSGSCRKRRRVPKWWEQSSFSVEDEDAKSKLEWVKQNFMIYNYCDDTARFATMPAECTTD